MPGEQPSLADPPVLSRFAAELGMALLTAAFGAIAMVGAAEFGIGWSKAGPEAGAFPFLVGLAIFLASLVNLLRSLRYRGGAAGAVLTRTQALRVLSFFGPMVLFAAVAVGLGLYVATVLYLAGVMVVQGGYRIWQGVLTGLGAALFFYVVLERWFQVPLLKGPLEAALGIH
jgi:hypothetical protein